ncbi:aspartyl/asparaginyl beta-hydroxylase (cupin superfamily) [Sphingomonas jinjuensis]|uniref:Aspartyl/asparaginyl beta-hydroxylase (Cupin superfamily) n=1 Tax=Sphingomonas jinjuensis TaxID=535907 RepID=A0A840F1Q0_9SPHN|nr:aspartyl/asparaginyl beta-hydroxylase domain-containing protein [Sphingomonas jinjuensis]MBB4153273.1 aspartyl/asparaginyl beta-hydroxylase (cupin superfamily) [Sphingomonas jinjuensis]
MSAPDPRLAPLIADAAAARQRGDVATERRLLDQAMGIAPDNPQVLNARGMRAIADGDGAMAARVFAAAAERDPGQPILLINLATAERLRGDADAEAAALSRALDIDRLNFVAQLRLAELNQRRGDDTAAAVGWSGVVQMAAAMPDRPPMIEDALQRGRTFLAAHTAALDARINDAIGGALAAMGPDGRRIDACIGHLLGRRAIYANQPSGVHVPFLPADEFFDRRLFPWFAALEAQTDAIRAEALALVAEGIPAIRPYVRQEPGTPENKWTALDNNTDWSACFLWEYGLRNDEVCERCPATAAALAAIPQNDIPGKAPTAFFSILRPGAHIPPHTGVTNTRAIVHLPLVVPDGCTFRVGGETRPWREGEAFAFDDTIEHEAWNPTAQPRIVLILDVWNPHLGTDEQRLLKELFRVTGQGAVKP